MPKVLSGKILVIFHNGIVFNQVEELAGLFGFLIVYRPQNNLACYHIAVPAGEEIHWARKFKEFFSVKNAYPI